jgi:small subunit ribosomal protein S17
MSNETTTTTTPAATPKRHRHTVRGIVVSDKMDKTRVISLKRTRRHRLYQKKLVRESRLFVHDEKNESKVGDVIIAISSSPLSKNKHYRMTKIVEKRVGE